MSGVRTDGGVTVVLLLEETGESRENPPVQLRNFKPSHVLMPRIKPGSQWGEALYMLVFYINMWVLTQLQFM